MPFLVVFNFGKSAPNAFLGTLDSTTVLEWPRYQLAEWRSGSVLGP